MSRRARLVVLLIGALGVVLGTIDAASAARPGAVVQLDVTGVVDPFMASYVERGIADANSDGSAAVLLRIDTPGGLDSSMRDIIKAILGSKVPVICYTAPPGARAASAGTFIMLACPVAAMAPGTNIGAAHPVGVSGAIESEKVTNDAAAYIRSLAERWGRNAEWAEQAVRESVSVSAEEALTLRVVDLVEPSTPRLLETAGGCTNDLVPTTTPPTGALAGGAQIAGLCDTTVEHVGLGPGAAILHGLIDPNLAFLFFFAGLVLIVIELLHPGISVPGVLGTLMLVTAFISFGLLPVQLGGVALLIASAAFFLVELKHPGLGAATVGGVVTLILGGLLLFDPAVPSARVSPWLIGVLALMLALFFGFVVRAVVRARRMPVTAGLEELVGTTGVALDELDPRGRVRAAREVWTAEAIDGRIPAGTTVRVVRVVGVRLVVEPAVATPASVESTGREPVREGGTL